MIISINVVKVFDQIQHLLMIKSQITRNRWEPPQLHKEHLQKKAYSPIILKGERLHAFPPKIMKKKGYHPLLLMLFTIVLEVLACATRQEK